MVRVIFDGSSIRLGGPAASIQTGSGSITGHFEGTPYQRGYGFYMGTARQRGAGVGTVMRRLWRFLRPLASTVAPIASGIAKEIGKEGLETGARVLSEVSKGGATIGDVVEREGREGAKRLLTKAHTKLSGGGRRRRRTTTHPMVGGRRRRSKSVTRRLGRVILKPSDVIGRTVPQSIALKKRRLDQLKY